MPALRFPALAALAASAFVAAGCAGGQKDSAKDFTGEEKQVATVVEDLQDAGRSGDADKICDQLLSAKLVTQIKNAGRTTCPTALDNSLDDVDSYEIQVKDITVTGTTATARIESEATDTDRPDTLALVKERGRWKIASLGR